MSFLKHIKQCNQYQSDQFLSFFIDDQCFGLTHTSHVDQLLRWPDVFQVSKNNLSLNKDLDTPEKRTAAVDSVIKTLHKERVIDSWVGEQYSISTDFGGPSMMLLERAAVAFLGVQGYGIHLNGLVRKTDGIYVWVAVRSKSKPFWPGQLDQIVAGGQPEGISLLDNLVKEAAEEAAIEETVARTSTFASEIRYCSQTHRGLNNDGIFAYDLWLDETFIPHNTDGEVESFQLIPIEEMARITETTDHFKDNCNLVNIDLLLRMGLIDSNHPEHAEIISTLYKKPAPLLQTTRSI
jgi:hypothetical protein